MPRYSSNGPMDAQLVDDADLGWTKVNMRMRGDQLPAGTLALSQNGRLDIDGSWQPRKGLNVFGPIIATSNALQLPFNLDDNGTPPRLNDDQTGIYGAGIFSNPYSVGDDYIVLAGSGKAIFVKVSNGAQTDVAYPATYGVTAECHVMQAFNYVFIFKDGEIAFQWNATSAAITGSFSLVRRGVYTQPVTFGTTSNTSATDGVVTVTETAHGLVVGDRIVIIDPDGTGLTDGKEYWIATATTNSFTFYAPIMDCINKTVHFGKPLSIGLGFTHMPTPPWAVYQSRRLWMPFKWTMTGTSGSPVITSRNVQDELIVSDILDHNTYDQIQANFRIASGAADYIVGLQPFADDGLIVFCRNSIHLIQGTTDPSTAQVKEITREVGCVARKSIVTIGNRVFSLSDNGVYSLDFGDLYNLRGATLPLSETIDPLIKRINGAYASSAAAVFHDNRYWLAVPLDSSITNNAIFIYNFLNESWEAFDTINSATFDANWLLEAGASSVNRLFYVASNGAIHEANKVDSYQDTVATEVGLPSSNVNIVSQAKLRGYNYGVIDKKSFNNVEIHVESSGVASNARMDLEIVNPDATVQLNTVSELLGSSLAANEDATLRGRIGNVRGYSGSLIFTPTSGRPKLRAVKIGASLAMKSQQSNT